MFLVSACRTGKSPLVAGEHIEGVFRLVGISDAPFGKESQSFLQQFSCVFRGCTLPIWLDASDVHMQAYRMRTGSMASALQRAANRANANRSTGPKTPAGKLRSSRNALKHGLSDLVFSPNGENREAFCSESCRRERQHGPSSDLVQSQSALSHIRLIRANLIAAVLEDRSARAIKQLKSLDRYERVALRKRKKAMNNI
jgi:hypothetical protein